MMLKQSKKVFVLLMAVVVCFSSVKLSMAAKAPSISAKTLTLKVGESKKLKVKNAKKVKWKSKNKEIATVSKKGVVKALKEGSVKIIAKTNKKTLSCKVTVTSAEVKVSPAPAATKAPEKTAAPTVAPTSTPSTEPAVVPTENPFPNNPPTQVVWPLGMKSGLEDDFNKYFKLDMTEYDRKKGTKLGSMNTISYYSEVVGADRECFVFLPPGYDETVEYPVIYMIHGFGCTGGQWVNMNIRSYFSTMIGRGEVPPFIAVIPSVVPKDGIQDKTTSAEKIQAYTMFEEEFTKDLEPYIIENYSVSTKPENTGICGLSMGGAEALTIGFDLKSHFNYIGAFSGAPTADASKLDISDWDFAPKMVMICIGDKDMVEGSLNYHNALTENGVEHIWYLYPGGEHSDPVWKNAIINFVRYSLGDMELS